MPIISTIFDLAVCGVSVKDTGAFRVEFSEYTEYEHLFAVNTRYTRIKSAFTDLRYEYLLDRTILSAVCMNLPHTDPQRSVDILRTYIRGRSV